MYSASIDLVGTGQLGQVVFDAKALAARQRARLERQRFGEAGRPRQQRNQRQIKRARVDALLAAKAALEAIDAIERIVFGRMRGDAPHIVAGRAARLTPEHRAILQKLGWLH